jgi:hypothetical protein
MAIAREVLAYLLPDGGYVSRGESYEDIEFIEVTPVTKEKFEAGFAAYDAWKAEQDAAQASSKAALLDRLGITAEEARLLLS